MMKLSYTQSLKLGAIRVRREFAEQARARAMAASLAGDWKACEMYHSEADQHEDAIVAATVEFGRSIIVAPPAVAGKVVRPWGR